MKKEDKKALLAILVLLFVSVTLAFSTSFFRTFQGPKQFFLVLFTGVLTTFWGFSWLRYRWRVIAWKPLVPVHLYMLFVLISVLASGNPARGVDSLVELFCPILVFTVIYTLGERELVEKLTPYILFTGAITAVYSLVQHFGIDPVGWAQAELVRSRSISTFGNPDFLSSFLVMVIPVALAKALGEHRTGHSLGYFGLWGFLCMVNIFTYSRTGLISMIVGIAAVATFAGWKALFRHRWKPVALVAILILALGSVSMIEALGHSQHTLMERTEAFINPSENNVATRLGLWKAASMIFARNFLFGVGPGNFGTAYLPLRHLEPVIVRNRAAMPTSAHNLFLDVSSQSGVLSLLALLTFIGFLIYYARKYFTNKNSPSPAIRYLSAGYGGTLVAYFTHHMAVFSTLPSELFFWISAALCLVLSAGKRVEMLPGLETPHKFKPFDWLAVGFLGLISMLAAFTWGQKTLGEYYAQKGDFARQVMSAQQNPEKRAQAFKRSYYYFGRAAKMDRENPAYWIRLGKVLEEYSYSLTNQKLLSQVVSQAENAYRTAISMEPKNPYPYADLARMMQRYGLTVPAERYSREAVRLDPYNPILNTHLAIILQAAGKPDEAEKYFRLAVEVYPPGADGYGNLGIFYFNLGRYAKAREMFTEALKRNNKKVLYMEYLNKIDRALQEKGTNR